MGDMVLEGGISYDKYVWHSSGNACEACQDLDGTEYEYEGDIPDQPHPNCQCYIEVVKGNEDGEECDCVEEEVDAIIDELEEANGDAESIIEELETEQENIENKASNIESIIDEFEQILNDIGQEYSQHLINCENNIDEIYDEILNKIENLKSLLIDILDLLELIITKIQVFYFFSSNFVALMGETYIFEQKGMDKYRHSVANCQGAQLGELGENVATELSDFKEEFDQYKNIYAITHKVSKEEAIADSERDQIANRLGRERGRNNPTCDCRILMQDLKP